MGVAPKEENMNGRGLFWRAALAVLSVGAVLAAVGATSPDGFAPGTRVEGTLNDGILILRNLGSGAALRADNVGTGSGVLGYGKSGHGLHGITDASGSAGVFGVSTVGVGVSGRSDTNDGVVGVTTSSMRSGVYGHSPSGVGVSGTSGTNDGIVGWTDSAQKSGIFGWSTNGTGVTASSSAGTALLVDGTSIFKKYASFEGGHGDIAENYRASEPLEAGDVVVISDEGGMMLALARTAYDTSVVGVIAGSPSLRLAGGLVDAVGVPLALIGRVQCKVDAQYGAIAPGDLLTSSPTPGHAMKAEPLTVGEIEIHRPGTVIGKALQSWTEGSGQIEIIVTLQ
jgi:hypothetical protein